MTSADAALPGSGARSVPGPFGLPAGAHLRVPTALLWFPFLCTGPPRKLSHGRCHVFPAGLGLRQTGRMGRQSPGPSLLQRSRLPGHDVGLASPPTPPVPLFRQPGPAACRACPGSHRPYLFIERCARSVSFRVSCVSVSADSDFKARILLTIMRSPRQLSFDFSVCQSGED